VPAADGVHRATGQGPPAAAIGDRGSQFQPCAACSAWPARNDGGRTDRCPDVRPDLCVWLVPKRAPCAMDVTTRVSPRPGSCASRCSRRPPAATPPASRRVVSPWEYLLNQAIMIMRYLRLAVWPRGLVLDYGDLWSLHSARSLHMRARGDPAGRGRRGLHPLATGRFPRRVGSSSRSRPRRAHSDFNRGRRRTADCTCRHALGRAPRGRRAEADAPTPRTVAPSDAPLHPAPSHLAPSDALSHVAASDAPSNRSHVGVVLVVAALSWGP
jgi:hypothetical protein